MAGNAAGSDVEVGGLDLSRDNCFLEVESGRDRLLLHVPALPHLQQIINLLLRYQSDLYADLCRLSSQEQKTVSNDG